MSHENSFWTTEFVFSTHAIIFFHETFCAGIDCSYVHSKFLFGNFNIFKYNFYIVGASTPTSQCRFSIDMSIVFIILVEIYECSYMIALFQHFFRKTNIYIFSIFPRNYVISKGLCSQVFYLFFLIVLTISKWGKKCRFGHS